MYRLDATDFLLTQECNVIMSSVEPSLCTGQSTLVPDSDFLLTLEYNM